MPKYFSKSEANILTSATNVLIKKKVRFRTGTALVLQRSLRKKVLVSTGRAANGLLLLLDRLALGISGESLKQLFSADKQARLWN